jgi:Raf kinase inhibitor-like YbhB/YbcL family protein
MKTGVSLTTLAVLTLAMACSDDAIGGAAGSGGTTAGTGTAGTATSGTGAAGTGTAGTGTAGARAGTGGTGAAGTGAAGTGAAGTGAAGTGAAGTGAAGTGAGTGGAGGASGSSAGTGGAAGGGGGAFTLTSTAVMAGGTLPAKHRCAGSVGGPTGPSPALSWTGAPAGTMSFAVLLRDRTYMDYEHWTIYDIPASTTSLPEMVPVGAAPAAPAGAKQAPNALGLTGPGYYGPCGASGVNMYEFTVYALDVAMLPMPGTTGDSVQAAVEMHDLGKASLLVMSAPP